MAGSEPEFIAEHYWGYSRRRAGTTVEYEVRHPPWEVWVAEESQFQCDVARLYGEEFVSTLAGPPTSAFVARGSEVAVHPGHTLSLP